MLEEFMEQVLCKLDCVLENQEKIMATQDQEDQALAQLSADAGKTLGDTAALLAQLKASASDPARVQSQIDAINALDAKVKAADPVGAPSPSPSPAPAPSPAPSPAPTPGPSPSPAPAPGPGPAPGPSPSPPESPPLPRT